MKVYIVVYGYGWEAGGGIVYVSRSKDKAEEALKAVTMGDWKTLVEWDTKTQENTTLVEY